MSKMRSENIKMATKYEKITNIRNEDRHNFPFSYFRSPRRSLRRSAGTISYFVALKIFVMHSLRFEIH